MEAVILAGGTIITLDELSKALMVTRRTIDRDIERFKKDGILERARSTRKGKWIVKL